MDAQLKHQGVTTVVRLIFLILTVGILLLTNVLAQRERLIQIDQDGDFHVRMKAVVAGHELEPGMYRVRRLLVNGESMIAFQHIRMNRIKTMLPGAPSKTFRLKVSAERSTAAQRSFLIAVNDGEEQTIIEVRFKHDHYRYIFPRPLAPAT